MYRFRSNQLVRLLSNGLKTRFNNYARSLSTSNLHLQSDQINVLDTSRGLNVNRNLIDMRERRLQVNKRNSVSGEYDVLSETIIKCESIEHLLELIASHVNVMNSKQLSECFETIHDLIRNGNYHEDCLKLMSSPEFGQLCNQTVKRMRFFQVSEILTTLKTLVFINVSPNTTIVQSLLQMTRQLINDFTLNDIVFLDFLLSKGLDKSRETLDLVEDNNFSGASIEERPPRKAPIIPLIEALKLAIPLVLQLKIEAKEINFDDSDLVIKCIRMAAKHSVKEDIMNKLVAIISTRLPELNVNQKLTLIASLMTLSQSNPKLNSGLIERILSKCLDSVTAPNANLPKSVSHYFLLSLVSHPKTRHAFYHHGLFEMVANSIIQNQNKLPVRKITGFLLDMTKQGHVNYALLDMIADRIALHDPELVDSSKASLTNVLNAFALPSNYRPHQPHCEVVYENILNSTHVKLCKSNNHKTKHLLFRMLRQLAVLQYYPEQEIKDWLSNYLDAALSDSTLVGLRLELLEHITILYQGLCLETDPTAYDQFKTKLKTLVDELTTFQIKEFFNDIKSPTLDYALSQGLGGPQFVASNLLTDYGHVLDNVVVMRKGGYPVAIKDENTKLTHLSQLEVPSDSQIIGIIGLTTRDYCRVPFIKRGITDFRLRTIRKLGIKPIAINLNGWESLAEVEKIPFIMREIGDNAQ